MCDADSLMHYVQKPVIQVQKFHQSEASATEYTL